MGYMPRLQDPAFGSTEEVSFPETPPFIPFEASRAMPD